MLKQFEINTVTRKNILKTIDSLSLDQLNVIPEGFKNSIIWNTAHVVVTQELLCYKLSGLEMSLDNEFIDRFKKGSDAGVNCTQEEVNFIKDKMLSLADKLKEDYNNSIFKDYTVYPTSYNVTLNNVDEAIQFNNAHTALHFGYIMAMKKSI